MLIAGAMTASGCSGQYPLGDANHSEPPLVADGDSDPVALGDARVPGALAAPEFTIPVSDFVQRGDVASLGDLDGDGRDEMGFGASDDVSGVSFVHVRYGAPRPRNDLEVFAYVQDGATLAFETGSGQHLAPSSAGDVDGDGYGDFVVIGNACAPSFEWQGVYLVYGGPERLDGTRPLSSVAAHFIPTAIDLPPGERLVCGIPPLSVAAPGDIDGDGFDDLVLGASPPFNLDVEPQLGKGEGLYVFYGRSERFAGNIPFTAADASIVVEQGRSAYPTGDVNGDGLGDMFVAVDYLLDPPSSPLFFVPGRTSRWGGSLDLATVGVALGEAQPVSSHDWFRTTGDIDGDGLSDVLVADNDGQSYLFYGAPGLFADGIALLQADAVIARSPTSYGRVYAVGDRDADGDDELLDSFGIDVGPFPSMAQDVVLMSGSRERLSGPVSFPQSDVSAQHPAGPFPDDEYRVLNHTIPAGDIDGDGAVELFTFSQYHQPADGGGSRPMLPLLHVHYGRPAAPLGPR